MKDLKKIKFNEKDVEVQELTVLQIRQYLSGIEGEDEQFIDELMDSGMPARLVEISSGVSIEEQETCCPSDLDKLYKTVKETNPILAAMIKRKIVAYEGLISKK